MVRRFLTAFLLLGLASPILAWNKAGHMVTASIAYSVLKEERPAAIPKLLSILKQHPEFSTTWSSRLSALSRPTEEEKDLYIFMLAARWADDIRGTDEYHHSTWHYINLPYKMPGQSDGVRPLPPDPDNIIRAYDLNLGKAKDPRQPAGDRAIAVCWVFHLIGDAHQPLHTSSMYSTTYPKGDKGGNKFYIRAKAGASGITLHEYWDNLIIGSDRFQSVRNRATELRLRPEFAKDKLKELKEPTFEKWVTNESFPLVDTVVYRKGRIAGGTDTPTAIALPEDYSATAKPVAERMAVLAGRRMAAAVRQIVGE